MPRLFQCIDDNLLFNVKPSCPKKGRQFWFSPRLFQCIGDNLLFNVKLGCQLWLSPRLLQCIGDELLFNVKPRCPKQGLGLFVIAGDDVSGQGKHLLESRLQFRRWRNAQEHAIKIVHGNLPTKQKERD